MTRETQINRGMRPRTYLYHAFRLFNIPVSRKVLIGIEHARGTREKSRGYQCPSCRRIALTSTRTHTQATNQR